jgi:hypothetical protein
MRARNLLPAVPANLIRRQAAGLAKTLHPMDRGAGRNPKPPGRSLPRHSILNHRKRHTLTQINRTRNMSELAARVTRLIDEQPILFDWFAGAEFAAKSARR